ncbi:MAG TPA: hypothetical protein VGP02_08330 [Mycobacteriales bacterium]|nr:hypothetical protein [Mycobacteriales bacterium]
MWRRFTLALVAANQGAIRIPGPDPHAGMWPVPWDPTPEQVARLATVLAGTLAESLADDLHDPIVRRRVSDLAAALRRNTDDPAFNIAFYSSGGAAMAAGVARRLHDVDGTHDHDPLSAESDAIVAHFAYSVATTSAMVDDGRIQHGERLLGPIVHPAGGDFWSTGMLFANGSDGRQYGAQFLADVGRSVLDWRRQHPDGRPPRAATGLPHPGSGRAGDRGRSGARERPVPEHPRRARSERRRVDRAGTVPRVLGEGGLLGTRAAANVFQAADNAQKSGLDRLPADLTRALGGTARTYIPDLAGSTRNPNVIDDMPEPVGSSYVVQSDAATARGVLRLLYSSPEQWGALQGTAEAAQAEQPRRCPVRHYLTSPRWMVSTRRTSAACRYPSSKD